MSESSKTLLFVVAAIVAVGLGFISKPSTTAYDPNDRIGKSLSEKVDPEEAKRMTIVRFQEDTATLSEFEVAETGGLWAIPSKGGYPADAEEQMAKAATGVTDLEILGIASTSAADHAQYGVVDPKSPKLEVGQSGVGLRVTLATETEESLIDLIIGKAVKDAEDQRYVRRESQDVVYIVNITPDDFSTDFADWIEDDLLKISPFDIQQVKINDYTAELVPQGLQLSIDWDRRAELELRYDDAESDWVAQSLKEYNRTAKEFQPFELSENQELNKDKLNDLKSALDDLKIVDVESKPAGLSASLKAGEDFIKDQSSIMSLVRRGIVPVGRADGSYDILSSEGEVITTMKDGVEYVLRFGNLQLSTDEEAAGPADSGPATGDEGEESKQQGVNRYLFVMARLNVDAIEKPELEDLPETPNEEADGGDDEDEAGSDSEDSDQEDADAEESENSETAESDDTESADADTNEEENSGAEKLAAERKAVEQSNQRKQDEYDEKVKQAKERVDELNARFGDWFYVISNDVYKKIHLGKDDIIKAKEKAEGDESDEDAESAVDSAASSAFGAPGAAVPGLPGISTATADEAPQAENEGDGEPAESTVEAITEETPSQDESS